MISPSTFRDIASGRRKGAVWALVRMGLNGASVPYGWAVAWRNRSFDRGTREIVQIAAPVVSVGNLTVGGTGKTPLVEWLARRFRQAGLRTAILSRGYRASEDGRNDEALELELALPDVPHLQNPSRAASASVAVEELASQILVLDDGFQHRQLARDLDIVLLDATAPFGMDRLLPRGMLREPVSGLQRAGVVMLSRADMLNAAGREAVRRRVRELAPEAVWCEAIHRPAALVDSAGTRSLIGELQGVRVAAFAGIGNPDGFRHTLANLGAKVVGWREFPDHHAYTRQDIEALAAWVGETSAQMLVCTRKDLVKLRAAAIGGAPLRAVQIELSFLTGEAEVNHALAPLVEKARRIKLPGLDDELRDS